MQGRKHYVAEGALLFTTVIWGATFALIKSALVYVSPLMFISLRFTLASLVLLPFVYKKLFTATRKHYKQAMVLGIIYFVSFAAQTVGLKYTSATKSAFITGMFVIFTPVFQTLIEKKIPGMPSIAAIVLAFFGVMMLSSTGSSIFDVLFLVKNDFNTGDVLTLFCAVMYAVYIVYLDVISHDTDYMFLTFFQIAFTAVCSVAAAGLFHFTSIEPARFSAVPDVIRAILYTSLVATIITTILQTKYQKFVSPTRASIIFSMEPIFASIIAFIILSERITSFGMIGAALIISGLIIAELFGREEHGSTG